MSREMMKIVDLIQQITMGPFGSDITVDNFIDEGVPVLNGSNINGVKLTEETFRYVSKEKAILLKKANTKRGDIVITHRGTLGQIAYIPEDSKYDNYIISQSQFRVTLKTELVDPIYFTYYFHTSEGQKRLLSFKNHVGVPALAQATTNFRLLDFPYRPIQTQKEIAKVLSDLDAKIELNNKINTELEAMAKLIYDYWFVQFDFPDKNGNPYKSSGGKMVYNEELKREIPVGWESECLNSLLEFKKGDEPGSKAYTDRKVNDSFVKFFRVSNINGNSDTYIDSSKKVYNYAKEGDVVVTFDGSVGKVGIGINGAYSSGLRKVYSPTKELKNSLVFLIFKDKRIIKTIHKYSTGSIILHASKSIDHLRIPYKKSVYDEFQDIIEPLYEKIVSNIKQNQKLAELRDWLLPMLMNGQVKVG